MDFVLRRAECRWGVRFQNQDSLQRMFELCSGNTELKY